jgi:hypothetical protein
MSNPFKDSFALTLMKRCHIHLFAFLFSLIFSISVVLALAVVDVDTHAAIGLQTSNLTLSDDTDQFARFTGEPVNFYANLTNITGAVIENASCTISFALSGGSTPASAMEFNSSNLVYQNISIFTEAGNFNFTVSCSHSAFFSAQSTSNFTILALPSVAAEEFAKKRIINFTLDRHFILSSIFSGETRIERVLVTNTGTVELYFIVEKNNLPYFASMHKDDGNFTLKPKESRNVRIILNPPGNISADISAGRFIFHALNPQIRGRMTQQLNTAIVVKEREALLDIFTRVAQKTLSQGDEVKAFITLTNIGEKAQVQIKLLSTIEDFNGNVYYSETDIVNVERKLTIVKSFKLSDGLAPGTYLFSARAEYDGKMAAGSDSFEVIYHEVPLSIPVIIALIFGFLAALAILVFVLWQRWKKR